MATTSDRPLAGIRVIDMADDRGELCGRLFADLGADVVLLEPPGGARARQAPPFAPDGRSSLYFAFRNAGKRGVTADVFTDAGREALHRLLDGADVWIESTAPGLLARHGLSPERVLERHPGLIITSITDFGQTGPYRDFAGTDMIGYAMGGMLYRAGAAHRPPVVAPGCQAYDTAGITAAFASAVAILARRQTGRGQWLDISVQEATANLADWSVPIYSTMQMVTHREGAGMYPVYRCTDGWLRLIIIGGHHWKTLRAWMGEPEALQDPTYDHFIARLMNRHAIEPVIQEFFRDWKKEDAAREAQARGIPATPVLRPAEVLDNEHTRDRRTFVEIELLPGARALVPSGFFAVDGERLGPTRRAPALGEHNEEILGATAAGPARRTSTAASAAGGGSAHLPFAGLRVVDFGIGAAGVEVGRLLGEYGAEVIKIESQRAPDFIRTVIPGPMNGPFTSSNRNKLSFGVNLKSPEGIDLVRRLVRDADVVIENSAAGVMDRLGLGREALAAVNPRLIMFSTQLLGSSGPWASWSGYGPNAHTVSGLQHLWNYAEDAEKPEGSTNIHPDHLVARAGAFAVVAALLRRERDGRGAHIDVAQFEALVQLLGDLFAKECLAPGSVHPQGNTSDRGAPWGVYPCLGDDEWCVINVRSDGEWAALREAMGVPAWAAASGYDTAAGRRRACDEIDAALGAWTRERRPHDVMALLQARGVPAAVVQHPAHQVEDPHLAARQFYQRIDQAGLGEVVLEGPGFRARGIAPPRVGPAPLLGEHTRAICRTHLGMTDAEVDALIEAGVLEEAVP